MDFILPPLRRCVAHFYGERSAFGDVAVLYVRQVMWLAVEFDALDIDVLVAVVYGLDNKLSAFDGELGAVNGR